MEALSEAMESGAAANQVVPWLKIRVWVRENRDLQTDGSHLEVVSRNRTLEIIVEQ